MSFKFHTYDAVTIRKNPTTQVAIQTSSWPDNTFRLWLPELVGDLWQQWNPSVAHQEFSTTKREGLLWHFDSNPDAQIEAELIPQNNSLLHEVRVFNRSNHDLTNVLANNCLHFSAAPDFACDDFSRIFVRSNGQWLSLAATKPTCSFPRYYSEGYPRQGRIDAYAEQFAYAKQQILVDHPLIVCVSKDGTKSIGVASEQYDYLFHNQQDYLSCIHSEAGALRQLAAGGRVTFRQKIYVINGGLKDCVAAFETNIKKDLNGEYYFAK